MARKLRVEYPGALYHIMARGNGRQKVFLSDQDRQRFLARLSSSIESYNVRVFLYCLMPNHIHLVLETPEGNVSRFMQSLMTGYTVYFNMRHRRCGHLFQGRFKSQIVEGNRYLEALSRYVHLNPVCTRAMVDAPLKERKRHLQEYKWSTYRGYAGMCEPNECVEERPLLELVGGGAKDARKIYAKYVLAGLVRADTEFLEARKGVLAIGGEEFVAEVQCRYDQMRDEAPVREDVSLRSTIRPLETDVVLSAVGRELGVEVAEFKRRQYGSPLRAIAGKALCQYAGLTQRAAARVLNAGSGAGLNQQLTRLAGWLEENDELRARVESVVEELERLRKLNS